MSQNVIVQYAQYIVRCLNCSAIFMNEVIPASHAVHFTFLLTVTLVDIQGDPKRCVPIFCSIKNPFLTNVFSVAGRDR